MYRNSVLTIEKYLAVAHQAVYGAIREASTFANLGLHDDLCDIQLELERLQESLLKRSAR